MNAFILEKYETHVLTNETIEVHLQYLRSGLDTVQAALPVLRDKIDVLSTTVDAKIEKTNARIEAVGTSLGEKIEKTNARIDALNTSLSEKIEKANEQRAIGDVALGEKMDALNASLSQKIEKANEQRAAGDTALGERVDKLTEKVSKVSDVLAEVQGYQKALFWVLSIAGTFAAVISIARTLNWI